MSEIKELLNDLAKHKKTSIVQKYIDAPLLVHKRKFDIRMFVLVTSVNNCVKGYFYKDGYLRTS